jgi:hypothetical protein
MRIARYFAVLIVMTASSLVAHADIIKIQNAQTCAVYGLDASPATSTGGVHCQTGGAGFNLSDLLSGNISLFVGNSKTPSWNIYNDTGSMVTSLTLFYSGALASNANIDMQQSNNIFKACVEVNANNAVFSDPNCGTKDIAPYGTTGVPLPLQMTWSTYATGTSGGAGSGVGIGDTFNISTASFAHAGADAGCISGTADCSPTTVPEPPSSLLLGSAIGLAAICGGFVRRSL